MAKTLLCRVFNLFCCHDSIGRSWRQFWWQPTNSQHRRHQQCRHFRHCLRHHSLCSLPPLKVRLGSHQINWFKNSEYFKKDISDKKFLNIIWLLSTPCCLFATFSQSSVLNPRGVHALRRTRWPQKLFSRNPHRGIEKTCHQDSFQVGSSSPLVQVSLRCHVLLVGQTNQSN